MRLCFVPDQDLFYCALCKQPTFAGNGVLPLNPVIMCPSNGRCDEAPECTCDYSPTLTQHAFFCPWRAWWFDISGGSGSV